MNGIADRKVIISNLESKINALKNILPKEMSVISIPGISVNAYELYISYALRMVEDAESSYDDFVKNRENSCVRSVRGAQEVEAMLYMLRTKIKKSIEVKSLHEINEFFEQAICGTKFDKRKKDDKITPLEPVHILKAIKEREETTWAGCLAVYDCDSEPSHPNGMGMANYVSPVDPNTQMIYFGQNDVECRLDIIESLLTYLDDLINSYNTDMKLLEDFKSLCVEKEQANIEL